MNDSGFLPRREASVVILASHAAEGGTVNYSNGLKTALEGAGYRVIRMALHRGPTWDAEGFDEIVLPVDEPSARQRLGSIGLLLRRLRTIRPRAVIGVMPLANVLSGVAAYVTGAESIPTHHGPYDHDGRVVRALDKLMGAARAYTKIVSVSNAVAASYGRHPRGYRDRMVVIPNGVRPTDPNEAAETTRRRHGIAAGRPLVLMAGRLAEQKNVLNAVRAMTAVPAAHLIIAGRGPLEDEVRSLIDQLGLAERTSMIGWASKQEVANLLQCCDAFLQVSLFEGQSLALLEAVHAGAALVVSDIPTQLEVVSAPSGLAAVVCDPHDVASIGDAISTALFDRTRRAEILRHGAYLKSRLRTEAQSQQDYVRLLKTLAPIAGEGSN